MSVIKPKRKFRHGLEALSFDFSLILRLTPLADIPGETTREASPVSPKAEQVLHHATFANQGAPKKRRRRGEHAPLSPSDFLLISECSS